MLLTFNRSIKKISNHKLDHLHSNGNSYFGIAVFNWPIGQITFMKSFADYTDLRCRSHIYNKIIMIILQEFQQQQ